MRPRLLTTFVAVALFASACVDDAIPPGNLADEVATTTTSPAGEGAGAPSPDDPVITVVSSDPGLITGGDALIRVDNPGATTIVRLNGNDVTASFGTTADGAIEGVVTGMGLGANSLAVTADGVTFTESLVNHPRRGPVFSGTQYEPIVCSTDRHGLGQPVDRFCSATTRVFWTYVDEAGNIVPLAGNPDDVTPAQVDIDGTPVDFFIRNEVGTINRGVYWLHTIDPQPAVQSVNQPWSGGAAWNGRLVMRYGPGCGMSHSQGDPGIGGAPSPELGGPVDLDLLRDGYTVATSTFTTFATHCNDVLSAETTMMVKERFIEGYGEPDLTIGTGTSGGSMQQLLVAQNYPGLLDGIVAGLPFADMITTMPGAMDCELLNAYYATEQGAELTADQRAAINGQLVAGACPFVEEVFGPTWSPAQGCDPSLAGQVYNPFFNPDGPLRCTPFDAHWRLFVPNRGEQPGVVVPPFDNSGVQYGLRAYQDGMIGLGQFLDLNQFVGGRGTDGQVVADRTRANRAQLERMYADGRVNQAGGDLRRIPIVLIDVFTDAAGDVHDRWRAFTIAERIGGGSSEPAPNVALWTVQTPLTSQFTLADYFATAGGTNLSALSLEALRAVDEWATAAAEQAGDAPAVDLAESRPDSAADRCQLITGDVVTGPAVNRPGGACGDLPISGDPRTAAGADIEALVLACTLRDIDLTDYRGELSTNAVARLERIFPDGVCDYERPGRGQVRLGEPYREY